MTRLPKRGDICVGDLTTRELLFVRLEGLSSLAEIDQTRYEIEGVVSKRRGKEVTIVHPKRRATQAWCERYSFKLTGYTLDGTARSGVLHVCTAASAFNDFTVNYNAQTAEQLVSQLNTFFLDTTNPVFQTQDWFAVKEEDDSVTLHFAFTIIDQRSNSGKSGFTLTANLLPEVKYRSSILRRNGNMGGEGVISSWYKALKYFRTDNSTTNYNPNTIQKSVKRTYPICLPAYLGKSEHRKDGQGNYVDYCAALRAVYGEGEEGWLKFMESCLPVLPTDYGNMGMRDGLERTRVMASYKYTSHKKTTATALCPAANYCYETESSCLPKGNWFLGTTEDISYMLEGVKYSSHTGDRNSDPLNKGLLLIGGAAISNSTYFWSCLRSGSGTAWYANGGVGFFGSISMFYKYAAVPLSLVKLA